MACASTLSTFIEGAMPWLTARELGQWKPGFSQPLVKGNMFVQT